MGDDLLRGMCAHTWTHKMITCFFPSETVELVCQRDSGNQWERRKKGIKDQRGLGPDTVSVRVSVGDTPWGLLKVSGVLRSWKACGQGFWAQEPHEKYSKEEGKGKLIHSFKSYFSLHCGRGTVLGAGKDCFHLNNIQGVKTGAHTRMYILHFLYN